MIESIYPKTYHRHTALPVLGPIVDDFAVWLSQCDYPVPTIRTMLGPIGRVDEWLTRRDIHDITELDALVLEACWKQFYRRSWAQGRSDSIFSAISTDSGRVRLTSWSTCAVPRPVLCA